MGLAQSIVLFFSGLTWAAQIPPAAFSPPPIPVCDFACADFQSTLIEGTCIEGTLIVGGPCAAAAAAPADTSTAANLIGSWTLNEQSGERYEDLTRDERAADFEEDNTEYLSITDGNQTGLDPGSADFSIAGWVNMETTTTNGAIASKYRQVGQDGYTFWVDTSAQARVSLYNNGVVCNLTASSHGAMSLGAWHFVQASYDATADECYVSVNDGTVDSAAQTGEPDSSTADFDIGERSQNSMKFDGRIASVGFWSEVISAADITALYNDGVGLQYADLTAALQTNLTSWWDLEEFSGSRIDSVTASGNNLVDNNTVTWGDGPGNLKLTDNGNVRAAAHHTLPARDFESSNSEYFTVADPWSRGDVDFGWAGTFVAESLPGAGVTAGIVSQYTTGARGFLVRILPSDDACASCLNFVTGTGGAVTRCNVDASTEGTLSIDTTYHFMAYYDQSLGNCYLSLNDGTVDSGAAGGALADTAAVFTMGEQDGSRYHDGTIGPIYRFTTLPTAAEWTTLYNDGIAQSCAQANTGLAGGTGVMSHCWQLDEYSGNALESAVTGNGVNLTDTNTVRHGVGQIPAAWDGTELDGVDQYLSAADSATLSISDEDYCVATWLWQDVLEQTIAVDKTDEYRIGMDAANKLYFKAGDTDTATWGTAAVANAWYSVVGCFDATNSLATIVQNGGTTITQAESSAPADTANALAIGGSSGGGNYWDGKVGPTCLWRGLVDEREATSWHNAGYGLTYEQLPDSLKNTASGLVSCWNLNRNDHLDSVTASANDLTNNNAATMAEGIVPVPGGVTLAAADFEAGSNEYLSVSDPWTSGDIDFSVTAWVNVESLPGGGVFPGIIAKDDGVEREWVLYLEQGGDQQFTFSIFSGGGAGRGTTQATTFGIPPAGTWLFLYAYHDAAANELGISVNDGVVDTAATSGVAVDTDDPVEIGRTAGNNSYTWDGLIGSASFRKRTLTAAERTRLYNSGVPLACDSLAAAGLDTNLVACWDLQELSGARAESGAGSCGTSCDLTDNNTVTVTAGTILGDAVGTSTMDGAAQYLSTDRGPVFGDEDFTLLAWVKANGNISAVSGIMGRWGGAGARAYQMSTSNIGLVVCSVSSDGTAFDTETSATQIDGAAPYWRMVACIHDATANTIGVSIDGATITTDTHSGGAYAAASYDFQVGTETTTSNWPGDLGPAFVWGRALSQAELVCLYGSQRGEAYPFTDCTQD